jgi:hypothetical protein
VESDALDDAGDFFGRWSTFRIAAFMREGCALRDPPGQGVLAGICCPRVRGGEGVSEVQAAFWATLATMCGSTTHRALWLQFGALPEMRRISVSTLYRLTDFI